jgi:hypothetical protein
MVLPLVLVLGIAGVVVGTFIGWSRRRTIVIDPAARNVLVRLRRRSWSSVLLGVLIGAATATALLGTVNVDLGRLASVAPAAGGTIAVLIVAFAELTTPHLEGDVRTASLSSRRPLDGVDGRAATVATAMFAALATALGLGWLMGDPDDMGRPGRSISTVCQTTGSGAGPWPGSFYAGPMLIAAGLLGLATIATVMASANRPRVGATSPQTDTLLRRASTRQILLVSAAAAAGSLMPVAGLMAMLLLGLSCRPWWYVPLGVFWGIVVVIASGVAAASLGTALWGPRLVSPAEEPVVVR